MSNRLERGLRAAVRGSWVRDGPANSAGEVLTLASSAGWPQGAPGEQGAMKLSAVNRCQVIISESVGKLPTYCVNEVTHERVNHQLRKSLRLATNMMGELKGDSAARATWYKNMREAGIFSVNDVRALEDMPDVDGGDERQASLNYVPLSDWKELSRKRAGRGGRDNAGNA